MVDFIGRYSGYFCILLIIIIGSCEWPISRKMSITGKSSALYGFWLYSASAVCALMILLTSGTIHSIRLQTVILSVISGVFNGLSFLITLYCLKIGYMAITVLFVNMSFIIPAIFSRLFLDGAGTQAIWLAGMALVIGGLLLTGISPKESHENMKFGNPSRKYAWLGLCALNWLILGGLLVCQLMTVRGDPGSASQYVFIMNFFAALVFLIPALKSKNWRQAKNERTYGIIIGALYFVAVYLQFTALKTVDASFVYAATIVGPLIPVLVISVLIYKERLKIHGWGGIAAIFGGISILAAAGQF